MTVLTQMNTPAATESEAEVTDRRRPGRLQSVSPELIPILRGETSDILFDLEDLDQSAPLKGLFYAILFSIPLWIGIIYLSSLLLS